MCMSFFFASSRSSLQQCLQWNAQSLCGFTLFPSNKDKPREVGQMWQKLRKSLEEPVHAMGQTSCCCEKNWGWQARLKGPHFIAKDTALCGLNWMYTKCEAQKNPGRTSNQFKIGSSKSLPKKNRLPQQKGHDECRDRWWFLHPTHVWSVLSPLGFPGTCRCIPWMIGFNFGTLGLDFFPERNASSKRFHRWIRWNGLDDLRMLLWGASV